MTFYALMGCSLLLISRYFRWFYELLTLVKRDWSSFYSIVYRFAVISIVVVCHLIKYFDLFDENTLRRVFIETIESSIRTDVKWIITFNNTFEFLYKQTIDEYAKPFPLYAVFLFKDLSKFTFSKLGKIDLLIFVDSHYGCRDSIYICGKRPSPHTVCI